MIKKNIYIIIWFLFLGLVFWRRFTSWALYTSDTHFISNENLKTLYNFYTWVWDLDIWSSFQETPRLFINGIVWWFASFWFTRNGEIIRRLFLFPYLILGFLGSYFLTLWYTKNKFLSMIWGLLYTINSPIILSLSMGHLHQFVGLGLFPWIILLLEKYKKSWFSLSYLLGAILLLFISTVYEFRFAYISFLTMSLYFFFNFLAKEISLKRFVLSLWRIWIGFILGNFFRLLPYVFNHSAQPIDFLARPPFGWQFRDILNGIWQFHSYRNGGNPVIFEKQVLPIYFLIIPFIALIWLFWRTKKSTFFYYLLLLLGIILVKQSWQPFAGLYDRIYNNLPGFNMFREGSRFYQLISLAYAIIIPCVLSEFYDQFELKKHWKNLYAFLLFWVIFYLLGLSAPIFLWYNKTLFQPKTPDPEFDVASDFIDAQKDRFKTLYIPRRADRLVYSPLHGSISFSSSLDDIFTGNTQIWFSRDNLTKTEFDNFIDYAWIKYIILNKISWSGEDDDPFYFYDSQNNYKARLDEKLDLKRVVITWAENFTVYENTGYYSLFNLSSEYPNTILNFIKINPTKYHIQIQNMTISTLFTFQQAFDKERNIYPYSTNSKIDCPYPNFSTSYGSLLSQTGLRFDSFVSSKLNIVECVDDNYTFAEDEELAYLLKQPMRENSHALSQWLFNSRELSLTGDNGELLLQKWLQQWWITVNVNWSYDVSLMLYFRPQSWFYLGTLITVAFCLLLLGYITISWIRNWKKND